MKLCGGLPTTEDDNNNITLILSRSDKIASVKLKELKSDIEFYKMWVLIYKKLKLDLTSENVSRDPLGFTGFQTKGGRCHLKGKKQFLHT